MAKIIGVNGIWTDGGRSTDAMLQLMGLRGCRVADFNYPWTGVVLARLRCWQDRAARALIELHQPDDHVIAHSYGCLVTLRAMELGARFGSVFLFAPAVEKDRPIPATGAAWVDVMHNPDDTALALGAMLLFHPFGTMGRDGYRGRPDSRVSNYRTVDDAADWIGHSHYFSRQRLGYWVDHIERALMRRYLT